MSDSVPSFFMLVPGPWRDADELVAALKAADFAAKRADDDGVQLQQVRVRIVEDAHLASAFAYGRRGALPAELARRVGACTHAAVIEVGQRVDEDPALVARLGQTLHALGGVAVRMEASGAASDWDTWLERLKSGSAHDLYAAGVLIVADDGDVLFTCGMHQFGLPDAQLAMSDQQEAIEWLDAFCVYQIEEGPALVSGHTFRPYEDAERRSFERWPDHRHDPNDGRHNPFGIWRFREPGDTGLQASTPVLVFIPSLTAVLLAAEASSERPLTRPELERIVSESAVVAMKPMDALALERSRGYADIEPELAWEQWQIVRDRS